MSEEDDRRALAAQMLAATTAEEIAAAERAADNWLATHPRDYTVLSAGEQLEMMSQARRSIEQRKI